MPAAKLCILLLEDSELDFELTQSYLRKGGVEFDADRVDTRAAFVAALDRGGYDIILADYLLPDFDGVRALEIARERAPEVPFVFVSGGLGEELAIDLLHRGAVDYVLKSRLDRLAPAVLRAVEEARERQERRRAEAELRQMKEHLEQRVAERTSQLRVLSGELTRVEQRERRRLAQVLHDHLQQVLVAAKFQLDMARRGRGERLEGALARIDELISESIEVSRSLTVELSPPVLYEASFAAALSWLAEWFEQKHGLAVEVCADDDAEPTRDDLRAALFNAVRELLFNVVKHARVDRAELHLRRVDDQRIRLVVEDAGEGFDVDSKRTAAADSRGFGLFSIEERLTFLGCEFRIDSRPGDGSTASIVAPCPRTRRPAKPGIDPGWAQGDAEAPARTAANAIRVLLVDDHKILREGLASLLDQQPDIHVVGQASNGEEAIVAVERLRPDVVVMDITMPRMDGIEATRRVTSRWPRVSVIGLSMHNEGHMAETMKQAGARCFLTKGGPVEDVTNAIRACAPAAGVGEAVGP